MADPDESSERAEARAALAAAELPANYFELYKLAVEMADRISARRGVANSFFLTANTGVVALLAGQNLRWYLGAAGIVLCASWWALLKSYRDLNRAKFDIILAMETRLPVRVFGDEWERLHPKPAQLKLPRQAIRRWATQYRELGRVERVVPWLFTLIYAAELLRQLLG